MDVQYSSTERLNWKGIAACELCKDSGVVALSTRNGAYRCAGPVPDYAKGVYEGYCECDLGRRLLREEVIHRRRLDDIVTSAKNSANG